MTTQTKDGLTDTQKAERCVRAIKIVQARHELLGVDSHWGKINKQQVESVSNQDEESGEIQQPFDFEAAALFVTQDIYHSTCIATKKTSCVGLGHVTDKAAEVLDPLCVTTWLNLLLKLGEDYFSCANAYMEVVRKPSTQEILGTYHLRAPQVTIHADREENLWSKHYIVEGNGVSTRRFADFGGKEAFLRRNGIAPGSTEARKISEVIHIPKVSALHRWYGIPDWLAAIPLMELTAMLYQFLFDFFKNRGVPEFMLFLSGGNISPDDWKKITDALKGQIGEGNSHKSVALQIPDEITIDLHKLAVENGSMDGQMFKDVSETSAASIVSAHRVPPLLAGIQIPGKLGSNNELPNALMGFQALVMGPSQLAFQSSLACTLGASDKNGGLGLSRADFEFSKITEVIDLSVMSTISSQREPVAASQAAGRKPEDGLKD